MQKFWRCFHLNKIEFCNQFFCRPQQLECPEWLVSGGEGRPQVFRGNPRSSPTRSSCNGLEFKSCQYLFRETISPACSSSPHLSKSPSPSSSFRRSLSSLSTSRSPCRTSRPHGTYSRQSRNGEQFNLLGEQARESRIVEERERSRVDWAHPQLATAPSCANKHKLVFRPAWRFQTHYEIIANERKQKFMIEISFRLLSR